LRPEGSPAQAPIESILGELWLNGGTAPEGHSILFRSYWLQRLRRLERRRRGIDRHESGPRLRHRRLARRYH